MGLLGFHVVFNLIPMVYGQLETLYNLCLYYIHDPVEKAKQYTEQLMH